MNTRLLRASPALLVVGGLGLAVVGALTGHAQQAVPAGILLVLSGAAAALHVSRARPRPVVLPGASPVLYAVPLLPTQRDVRTRLLPPPDMSPFDAPHAVTGPVTPTPAPGPTPRRAPARVPRSAAGRPRHCVLPRGELPHQRRAPGAS